MSPGSSGSHVSGSSPPQQIMHQQQHLHHHHQQQEHLQQQQGALQYGGGSTMDLSNIDYTLPMQLIEGGQDYQQVLLQTKEFHAT